MNWLYMYFHLPAAPLRLGMSPLVSVRRIQPPPRRPPPPAANLPPLLPLTPRDRNGAKQNRDVESQVGVEGAHVSSPASARRMAATVNSEYAASISTPAVPLKSPYIPLQRAVLMKTALKLPSTPRPQGQMPSGNETVLPIGRAASTPEGLAECISFNVSSVVPPSPIPANLSIQSYSMRTRSQSRQRKVEQEVGKGKGRKVGPGTGKGKGRSQADILMISPEAEYVAACRSVVLSRVMFSVYLQASQTGEVEGYCEIDFFFLT